MVRDEEDADVASRDDPLETELLRLIFESATDFAIFTVDPNGITTSWNAGAERLLGFTREEMVGQSADVTFPPEEGGAHGAAEERRAAATVGRAEDERWQQRKDGTRFWASGLLMPLKPEKNGFAKILRDRTEQHELEDRLRSSEEMFRVLATNVPQLVFRTKYGGERTWGSPQWSVFTGLDFSASLGLRWLDAVHPDDLEKTQKAWQNAAERGEYYVEHRLRRASDREFRWHQTRARPLAIATDHHEEPEWMGTSTDIHELKTLEVEQTVLLAELQHRTKNLLALVQSLTRYTMRGATSMQDFQTEFESRLRALGRAQSLFSRATRAQVSLRDLLELELRAHGNGEIDGARIHVQGPDALLPPDAVTPLALALHELATNAIKHGALSRPSGTLQITWKIERLDGHPRLSLAWQEGGVAIPADGRERRRGYGSELIERALPYQLGAQTRMDFSGDGLRCEIAIALPAAMGSEE